MPPSLTQALAAFFLALVLVLSAPWARAQSLPGDGPVALIADALRYDPEAGLLVATGNVEVRFGRARLTAAALTLDTATNRVTATGPIRLITGDDQVLLADAAELSADLREGLIEGARLILNNRLQIAASGAERTGGRYNTLYRGVATSCRVCAGERPVWQIRARRVIQDEARGEILFEGARFDIFGLPVAYVPRFRIPDPSINRASGFLVPRFSSSDLSGRGIKLPYYRVLGDHADATITPFLTTGGAAILEGEYRQRFRRGGLTLDGAFALSDNENDGFGRGFLAADGGFALGAGFLLDFDATVTSDDAFLPEFGYSDADRVTSFLSLNRYRARDFLEFRVEGYESLRAEDTNTNIPFILPEITFRQTFLDTPLGGRVGVEATLLSLLREGGESVLRAGSGVDWQRGWTLPAGMRATLEGDLDFDAYSVDDGVEVEDRVSLQATSTLGAGLAWPLVRGTEGATHILRPQVQLLFTEVSANGRTPNEDSLLAELDETNLFSANRFPGRDRREQGLRANLGLDYTRYDRDGWQWGLTLGQVLRQEDLGQFSLGTGLSGLRSDLVFAATLSVPGQAQVTGRSLFDEQLAFRRAELEVDLTLDRADFSGSYLFLAADPTDAILGAEPEREEFAVEGRYRLAPHWEVEGAWQYNLGERRSVRASGEVTYGNECLEVAVSVSRRFTDPSGLPPSTDFGLELRLAGLGSPADNRWPARRCIEVRG